jgi:hypothetical protein
VLDLRNLKVFITLICTLLLTTSALPGYSEAEVASNNTIQIQLMSDQKTVGAEGNIQYHLLYNVKDTRLENNLALQINVPDHLIVPEELHSNWDDQSRVLSWELAAQENAKTGVINFNLKASSAAALGDTFTLAGQVEAEGTVLLTTPEVTVTMEDEIHQPYFVGYPDGTFRPASNLTRAETAAVVSRIEDLQDGSSLEEPYIDVTEDHWAYEYINKVTREGYMEGYNGEFRPDDPISRAEFITIVLNIRGIEPIPLEAFSDTSEHWASSFIGTAEALNFINNDTADYQPDSAIPRDESAQLLNISFLRGKLVEGEIPVEQHFPDVPRDHPSFNWIEGASMVAHESERNGIEELLIQYLPDQTEPF